MNNTEVKRIKKDVFLFEKNIKGIRLLEFSDEENKVIEMAKRYCRDTGYYLKKQDYLTAFGCISYAHGLLDALRLIKQISTEKN